MLQDICDQIPSDWLPYISPEFMVMIWNSQDKCITCNIQQYQQIRITAHIAISDTEQPTTACGQQWSSLSTIPSLFFITAVALHVILIACLLQMQEKD